MSDLSKLENAVLANALTDGTMLSWDSEYERALLREAASRLQAPAVAEVEVKPLEWEWVRISYGPETYEASSPVGLYQVFTDDDSAAGTVVAEWAVDQRHFGMVTATTVGRYGGFEDAKAAAQADYADRIRSALRTGGSE